jgi:hypothetical protein
MDLLSCRVPLRKINIVVSLGFLLLNPFCISAATGVSPYESNEAFVKRNIPEDVALCSETIVVDAKDKERISRAWLLPRLPDSMDFVVGRDEDGHIVGAASFVVVYGEVHREYHHVGVALAPSGLIKEVAVMDVRSDRPGLVANRTFLDQFVGKGNSRLSLARDLDAITGATESSAAIVEAVNTVIALYSEFVKEKKKPPKPALQSSRTTQTWLPRKVAGCTWVL